MKGKLDPRAKQDKEYAMALFWVTECFGWVFHEQCDIEHKNIRSLSASVQIGRAEWENYSSVMAFPNPLTVCILGSAGFVICSLDY